MGIPKNIAGQRFGKLIAIEPTEHRLKRNVLWRCKCDCGNERLAPMVFLRTGNIKSCGCLQLEVVTKHGLHRNPAYRPWVGMRNRCRFPTNKDYAKYGARGIDVCDRWFNSLAAFIEDVGERPGPEFTIDRIDTHKGYFPGNVRWASISMQANNKRNSRHVELNGIRLSVSQWRYFFKAPKSTVSKYVILVKNIREMNNVLSQTVKEGFKPSFFTADDLLSIGKTPADISD